jgi:beta-lactamase class C
MTSGKLAKIVMLLSVCIAWSCQPKKNPSQQSNAAAITPMVVDSAFQNQWQSILENKLNFFQCPGVAISIIKDNQVIYEYKYGSKSVNQYGPIDNNTTFRIGSVSKGFAGVLAAILIRDSIICLNDAVSTYVPEFTLKARSKDKIFKIKHLLSHSSGLTEHAFSNLVDENHSLETLITNLNTLVPRDSTGIVYAYQNAAFGVIEKVIEGATGLPYASALQKYILQPLGMNHTSTTFEQLCAQSNVCYGHKWAGKHAGFVQIPFSPHYYNVASAGGVNSTLEDMKKWLLAIMGNPNNIGKKAFEIAFTPQVNTSFDDKYFNQWTGFKSSSYGLGWRLIKTSIGDYRYHGGLVNGFRAEIAHDLNTGIGMVVLFNSTCTYSNYIVPEFYEFWHQYHHRPDKINPEAI